VRARTTAPETSGAPADFEFYLADLPGYGFAQVPVALRDRWKPLIESYLGHPELRGVIQLIDARRGATVDDVDMLRYLSSRGIPALVALTKVDKLRGHARRTELAARIDEIGLPAEQLVEVSAITGEGCDVLLESMEELLRSPRATDE
jgi:GTP-binding protein